ncbi:hypothetical protein EMIT079MI2_280002 [Bacillus sp. IT-79MI2]
MNCNFGGDAFVIRVDEYITLFCVYICFDFLTYKSLLGRTKGDLHSFHSLF